MTYTKTVWQDGDIITVAKMNNIETNLEEILNNVKHLPIVTPSDAGKIFVVDNDGEIEKRNYIALPAVSSTAVGRPVVVNNNGTGYTLGFQPLITTNQINVSVSGGGSAVKNLATINMPSGYAYHFIEAHITIALSSAAQSGDRFTFGLLPNTTATNLFNLTCSRTSGDTPTSSLQTILVPSSVTKCSAETHGVLTRTSDNTVSYLRFHYLNSSSNTVGYLSSIIGYYRITSFN